MITLVLGGARSGKSAVAESLAVRQAADRAVTYFATLAPPPSAGADRELVARIAAHRARRPAHWATVELGDQPPARLAETLERTSGTVLLDSLGPWLATAPDFDVDTAALCRALTRRQGDTVVVSDEVGLSVHPSTGLGQRFRDSLGLVNQAVAAVAGDALLVVAGRILRLEPLP